MEPKAKQSPESVVREIKRNTCRKFSSEEKIRIMLEGLRGEDSNQYLMSIVISIVQTACQLAMIAVTINEVKNNTSGSM